MSGWAERVVSFGGTSDLLPLLANLDDPQLAAEAERLFFLTLASGWFTAFADPDQPDFVPAVNTHLNAVDADRHQVGRGHLGRTLRSDGHRAATSLKTYEAAGGKTSSTGVRVAASNSSRKYFSAAG